MPRKRKATSPPRNDSTPAPPAPRASDSELKAQTPVLNRAQHGSQTGEASAAVRVLFTTVVVGHLALLYLALSSNLFQSRLQQVAMDWASIYSVTTGQQYGMVPLEMTHAETFDLPLQVQTRESQQSDRVSEWASVDSILPENAPRWSNLSRNLRVILEDDPENEILSDFAFAIVQQLESGSPSSQTNEIRFIQPFVPDFDEGSALADGLGGLLDTAPQVLFSATIVRNQGRAVGLVPDQEDYRSSIAPATDKTESSSD